MEKPRFRPGDVLEVITYDQGDNVWEQGIIRIVDFNPKAAHTENGMYGTQHIKGTVTWLAINADVLNHAGHLTDQYNARDTFVKYLGNIKDSPALRILYGSNRTK